MTEIDKEHTKEVIDQLTRKKLDYSRELLRMIKWKTSGNQAEIRARLLKAINENELSLSNLQSLLNNLDEWGDQRIRILRFDALPAHFASQQSLRESVSKSIFSHLLDVEPNLTPPETMTATSITFPTADTVRFSAASLRTPLEKVMTLDVRRFDEHPDIVWVPYREEHSKSTAFADIELSSGICLLSTSRSGSRTDYSVEFKQFSNLFKEILDMDSAKTVRLFNSIRQIYEGDQREIRIYQHNGKTLMGGPITHKSFNRGADIRTDSGHSVDNIRNTNVLCNCYWLERKPDLPEEVHTVIYAPDGEVAIFGQVKEDSVKHVVRRILHYN